MKLDQSQSPANCPACKAHPKGECKSHWAQRIHSLAEELKMKVLSITPKGEVVKSKELLGGEE